jgi:hypothetical protein
MDALAEAQAMPKKGRQIAELIAKVAMRLIATSGERPPQGACSSFVVIRKTHKRRLRPVVYSIRGYPSGDWAKRFCTPRPLQSS